MAVLIKRNVGLGAPAHVYFMVADVHYFFSNPDDRAMPSDTAFRRKEGMRIDLIAYPSKDARKAAIWASFFRNNFELAIYRSEAPEYDEAAARFAGTRTIDDYNSFFIRSKLSPQEFIELCKDVPFVESEFVTMNFGKYILYKEEFFDEWPKTLDKASLYAFAYSKIKSGGYIKIVEDPYHPEWLGQAVDDTDSIEDIMKEGFERYPLLLKLV